MTTQPTLRRLPSAGFGDEARVEVHVGETKVGEVYRYRESAVVTYSGRMYGREVQRTRWTSEPVVGRGFGDHHTRRDAVEFLVAHAHARGLI